MLLIFPMKLVELKIVWLAQNLGIDLFGDGGSISTLASVRDNLTCLACR